MREKKSAHMGRINLSSERPSRASFFLIFFHVKQNIIILTIVPKKDFGKILDAHELFTKTYFRIELYSPPKCE